MDFNATVDIIIKDLEEARAIIDDLKNCPGVPLLQIELAKSKCKSAGEVIALLKNLPDKGLPETKREPELQQPDKEMMPVDFTIKELEPEPEPEAPHKVQEIKKEEHKKVKDKKPESSIIADRFISPHESVNERLGTKREDDEYSDIIKSKPVTTLSDAIGVNDKFLFIREIFDGNPESFEQAISRLDNAENLSAAKEIIKSYTEDNKETAVIRHLLDMVKRKFPYDE
jgi:hypothetical protein